MCIKTNNFNLISLRDLNINSFNSVGKTLSQNPDFTLRTSLSTPDSLFNNLSFNNGKAMSNISFDNVSNHVKNDSPPNGKTLGIAKGTGYYPANTRMEGGFHDKMGHKLNTLQDFLSGKAPYVSIALDKKLYQKGIIKYGDTFRIPELEKKYGRPIVFKAVDTGGAFTNKGFGRVDICTANKKASLDPTINGKLTLVKV